jgi:hypothetical protein
MVKDGREAIGFENVSPFFLTFSERIFTVAPRIAGPF